jgi:hypothetical protein
MSKGHRLKMESSRLTQHVMHDNLTGFPRDKIQLKKTLEMVEKFRPISGLAINREKSEVVELGMSAEGCGLEIKSEVKITSVWFAKDKQRMDEMNWGECVTRIKKLLDAWSGRRITIIGKANIIRAQIQPLVSFIAGLHELPEKIEQKLTRMTFNFL